jgi:hypothetical protein
MRKLRNQVATSVDGYIAGRNGEFDWVVVDPDVDFAALFAQRAPPVSEVRDHAARVRHRFMNASGAAEGPGSA